MFRAFTDFLHITEPSPPPRRRSPSPPRKPPPVKPNPLREVPWRTFQQNIWNEQAIVHFEDSTKSSCSARRRWEKKSISQRLQTAQQPIIVQDYEHDRMLLDLQQCFTGSKKVENANVVILGPVGNGKSSFINSVLSIGKTSVLSTADAGQAAKSYTTKLGVYESKSKKKDSERCAVIGNVKLYDTMGLEDVEDEGFNVNDVTLLLKGHIPKNYKFNPRSPITPQDKAYIKRPKADSKAHLVVFCVKAPMVMNEGIPKEMMRKIAQLQEKIKELGIPKIMIVTHVDEVCAEVYDDISKMFRSIAVETAVKKAGDMFKIPPSYIHPIENYHRDAQTNKKTNVPLLLALRHMLDLADDYFQRMDPDEPDQSRRRCVVS